MAGRKVFTHSKPVPCPRCYAPIAEPGAVCMSKGCVINRAR